MVYYIRFLKPPRLDVKKGFVQSLITVTTDLGDEFYPGALTLHAAAVSSEHEDLSRPTWRTAEWKTGMRAMWVEVQTILDRPEHLLSFVINTKPTSIAEDVFFTNLPEVLGGRCIISGSGSDGEICQASKFIERRYRTKDTCKRIIYEETRESIARHVWDAGITLASYLSHIAWTPNPISSLSKVLSPSISHVPKFIELGSGCGIVGLELAHLYQASDICLTDLPDAMEILGINAGHHGLNRTGRITTSILDWEEELPSSILQISYDVVIVSDCTYNSDRIPALVDTLAALHRKSPNALTVVSMKMRHESEAIFFELIADAGFVELDHVRVSLPDRQRSNIGQSLEVVHVYVYGNNAGS